METYYPQMDRGSCGLSQSCGNVNVGESERVASALVGGVLAVGGLRHLGSLTGLMMLAAGGGLLYRSMTGHCALYQQLGIDTSQPQESSPRTENHLEPQGREDFREDYDEVDEASYESFPASDPPAYSSSGADAVPRYPR